MKIDKTNLAERNGARNWDVTDPKVNLVTCGTITVKSSEDLKTIFSLVKDLIKENKPNGQIEVIHKPWSPDREF